MKKIYFFLFFNQFSEKFGLKNGAFFLNPKQEDRL